MLRPLLGLSVALVLAGVFSPVAVAQMAGSRGGVERDSLDAAGLPSLDPKVAEGYITIDGRAEVRVKPTDVRIVLAVTSEAETAPQCQQSIDATIDGLKKAWAKMGIGPERIVVDFIAVLPRYQWTPEKHGTTDVEVEKKVGYRMQTNVHLAAKGEAEARSASAGPWSKGSPTSSPSTIGARTWTRSRCRPATRRFGPHAARPMPCSGRCSPTGRR